MDEHETRSESRADLEAEIESGGDGSSDSDRSGAAEPVPELATGTAEPSDEVRAAVNEAVSEAVSETIEPMVREIVEGVVSRAADAIVERSVREAVEIAVEKAVSRAVPEAVKEVEATSEPVIADIVSNLGKALSKIDPLERHASDYFRHRLDAIEQLMDYLIPAALPGHYFEFGVFEGNTFTHTARLAQKLASFLNGMRCFGFDSFKGMPPLGEVDNDGGYTSCFYEGQYAATLKGVVDRLTAAGVDPSVYELVEGWFDESLTNPNGAAAAFGKCAFAWVDCDLYKSTIPVLNYLTDRLLSGAVLVFDDWRCWRNSRDHGQQRACAEWLARNPHLELRPMGHISFNGQAFTVHHRRRHAVQGLGD